MAPTVVQVDVLGPLRVRVGGERVPIASKKQRMLLVRLALQAGHPASSSELIDVLWGDRPPASAPKTLQTYVFRLRKVLGEATIRTGPAGYELALGAGGLDAHRFEEAVEAGQHALAAGEAERALDLLDAALRLWRGEPYVDLDGDDSSRAEAARLHELRAVLLEQRSGALLAVRDAGEVVPVLEALVIEHPFRERLWCRLMVALYRSGRQRDALEAYRRARHILVEELGIEPGRDLRRLEHAVLTQAPHLDEPLQVGAESRSRAPTASVRTADRTRVQRPTTSFVGRERELSELIALLDAPGLVTLTGPGGVGKTRLALEAAAVAAPWPDGVHVVELASVVEGSSLPDAVAAALGVPVPPGGSAEDSVVTWLRSLRCLLVLDNCEHVIDAARALVVAIAEAPGPTTILVTSREPLSLPGERVLAVPPFDVPDAEGHLSPALVSNPAVRLFAERARAARPGFALTSGNAASIVEICRRLDGLPLAIELAASQMRTMGPTDVARRLHERFRFLRRRARGLASRHEGLRAAIDWSYELLEDTERTVFDRLSVFVGGFDLEAAERVCAFGPIGSGDVPHVLAGLVEKSMVVAAETDDGSARYSLLESLRQYATERLAARGEDRSVRRQHADHFAVVARDAGAGLGGPDEATWVRRAEDAFSDIRAAHGWAMTNGEISLALSIPADFSPFRVRGEVLRWADAAIGLPDAERDDRYPSACAAAARLAGLRGDVERAEALGHRSIATAQARGRQPPSEALFAVALRGYLEGDADAVEQHLGRSALALSVGDVWSAASGLGYAAQLTGYRGDVDRALDLCTEALRLVQSTGNPSLRAGLLYVRGEILQDRAPDRARRYLEEALALAVSVRNSFVIGIAQVCLASVCARHGDPRRALELFIEVSAMWHREGSWRQQWVTLRNVAELLGRLDRCAEAAVLLGAIDAAPTAAPPFGAQATRLADLQRRIVQRLGAEQAHVARSHGAAMGGDESVRFARAAMEDALCR